MTTKIKRKRNDCSPEAPESPESLEDVRNDLIVTLSNTGDEGESFKKKIIEIFDRLASVFAQSCNCSHAQNVKRVNSTQTCSDIVANEPKISTSSASKRPPIKGKLLVNANVRANTHADFPELESTSVRSTVRNKRANKNELLKKLPTNFANAVKKLSSNGINPPKLRNFNSNKNVLLLKNTKTPGDNSATEAKLASIAHKLPELKIIRSVATSEGLKISLGDNLSSQKLEEALAKSKTFTSEHLRGPFPEISLFSVPNSLLEDKHKLISDIATRNGVPIESILAARSFKASSDECSNLILRVLPETRKILISAKRVFVQYLSFRVFDSVRPLKCFNCQKFGHTSKVCRSKTTCGYCAKGHSSKDCQIINNPLKHKCANCEASKLIANHHTAHKNCPSLLKALIRQAPRINYG